MGGVILPTGPQILALSPAKIRRQASIDLAELLEEQARRMAAGLDPLMAGGASFADAAEKLILEHAVGKASWTMPTNVYLALCTTVPTDASTGATIVEATGATGYARLKVEGTKWTYSAPAIKNNAVLTFPEVTAGSAVVKGFGITDSATTGAGTLIAWGTCPETTISTTQTPPTVNSEQLVVELD